METVFDWAYSPHRVDTTQEAFLVYAEVEGEPNSMLSEGDGLRPPNHILVGDVITYIECGDREPFYYSTIHHFHINITQQSTIFISKSQIARNRRQITML